MKHHREFQLLTPEELEQLPDLEWVIDGILPQPCLAVLYGDPGCGKTFVALSIALAAASGEPWLGRKSSQTDVLYIAAEGVLGLKSRVAAHRIEKGPIPAEAIRFLPGAPNLLEGRDLASLSEAMEKADFRPGLIVVDTLARVTTGADENNAKDMGRAVAALDALKEAFGASVLVLHHKTKSGGSERGSGALRGGADVMIEAEWIDAADGPQVSLKCDKMKDAEPFKETAAALKRVDLPTGRSSLIVSHETMKQSANGPAAAGKILAILQEEFADNGATNSELFIAFKAAVPASKSTFDRGLRALKKAEEVRVIGQGKGAKYFPVGVSVTSVSD